MSLRADPIRSLFLASGGLLIWAAHFGLVYATQTTFCTLAQQPTNAVLLRVIAIGLTAIALGLLIGLGLFLLAKSGRAANALMKTGLEQFLHGAALAVVGMALVAVLWSVIPLLVLPACAAPAV